MEGTKLAVEVWDPAANKYIQMLEMVQNEATCFVGNLREREGVKYAKEQLGLEPLQERHKMQRIKTMHKIMGPRDTSFVELNDLINVCFKEDRPETRAKGSGQPLTILTERNAFFNSFVPKTMCDLDLIDFRTILLVKISFSA